MSQSVNDGVQEVAKSANDGNNQCAKKNESDTDFESQIINAAAMFVAASMWEGPHEGNKGTCRKERLQERQPERQTRKDIQALHMMIL